MPPSSPINPRKKFNWKIEFTGLDPFLAQRVKIPAVSLDVAEHGQANVLIKTPGMVKIGDIEINKMKYADKNENWAYDWLRQCSNPETGVMGVPTKVKRNGYFIQFQPDGRSVLEKYQFFGAFPKNIEPDEFDAKAGADNLMEKVILSVDFIVKIP